MTNTINSLDFNDIVKTLNLTYYNNLLKSSEKSMVNKRMIEMRIEQLKSDNKIEIANTQQNEINTDKPPEIETKTVSETSQKYNDDYLYKKPWNKLTSIHKKIKVKEFVNMLLINDDNDKEELKNKLSQLIDNKELTKKDRVIYDSSKGMIASIPLLKYSNGKYLI